VDFFWLYICRVYFSLVRNKYQNYQVLILHQGKRRKWKVCMCLVFIDYVRIRYYSFFLIALCRGPGCALELTCSKYSVNRYIICEKNTVILCENGASVALIVYNSVSTSVCNAKHCTHVTVF